MPLVAQLADGAKSLKVRIMERKPCVLACVHAEVRAWPAFKRMVRRGSGAVSLLCPSPSEK